MTSSLKRTLRGMLTLAIVFAATEARAQKLETPGPAPAAAPAAPTGPASFGDAGQLVISPERLFGFSWRHQSGSGPSNNTTAFSLLDTPLSTGAAAYSWPRLGFDYFVVKGISVGAAALVARASSTGGTSNTFFEAAPRFGYVTKLGPWLSWWPRLGFTYVHDTNGVTFEYSAITLESPVVISTSDHVAITFGPSLDLGIAGKAANANFKATDVAVMFGLAVLP